MEKYGNKSPLMKILHKYTGFIVVGVILAIAIPLFLQYESEQFFFEKWSCSMINQYRVGVIAPDRPPYTDLTEKELERFDDIWSECQ